MHARGRTWPGTNRTRDPQGGQISPSASRHACVKRSLSNASSPSPSLCCHRHALPHIPFHTQTRLCLDTHARLTRLARSETARVQHSSAHQETRSSHAIITLLRTRVQVTGTKDRSTLGLLHTRTQRSGVSRHDTFGPPAPPEYEQHVYKRSPAELVALFKHARSQEKYTWRKDKQQKTHGRDHRGAKSALVTKKKTSKAADHAAAPLSYNASRSLPVGGQRRLG